MKLEIGQAAPDFEAKNQNGETVKLSDFRGQKVVLYFYPKDNTPTCTVEACNIRDNYQNLTAKGFKVFGVSPDSEKSHNKFISKFQLPFDLLVDEEQVLVEKYKVWAEKTLFGKKYMGVIRTTFIIDENGNIEYIIDKVESKNHSAQILREELT